MKNNFEILQTRTAEGIEYSITRVLNSNGHSFFQFRMDDVVRWWFKAYEYAPDGVTSYPIIAPYGLGEKMYSSALDELIRQFNSKKY